ncbi:MAG: 4-alpha-glucanotransferase, partial [Oscillospiraceae bacterium]|nr:4-alpha-glucanotransferase [Oscillospiraceae bacterium]
MERSSGILMPVFSLPSKYGIGTFGKAAYEFVDFLKAAKQSWWQILPVGPTSYGDSPYQSFSTFAGNPYFVDLELLCEDGYLKESEIPADVWGADPMRVDYGAIYNSRFAVLSAAAKRAWQTDEEQLEAFWRDNGRWLPDYALFMSVKAKFGMLPWYDWPDEAIRLRSEAALAKYGTELNSEIRTHIFIQYQFYKQWDALRSYAHENGVKIIGDLPIYVAMDSADVWANPSCFQLDARRRPTAVAGVPPDAFSEEGQLWGNPLYDWQYMQRDGYSWWMERIAGAVRLYDALRIDHFRGFESYWAVPADAPTAITGSWEKGPGMDFVGKLTERFPETEFLAEDLGILTDSVRELLRDSKLPGMKVLEFAFSPDTLSDYLMHGHIPNSVCYCGTHDNTTLLAWRDEMSSEE